MGSDFYIKYSFLTAAGSSLESGNVTWTGVLIQKIYLAYQTPVKTDP